MKPMRGDQRRVGQQAGRHPDEARPARRRAAPAGASMSRKPPVQRLAHDQHARTAASTDGHHPGQEVRADAAVAGGRGHLQRARAEREAQQQHAGADQRLPARARVRIHALCSTDSPRQGEKRPARPGVCSRPTPLRPCPDFTMVARRLANSSSTNFSNAGAGQHRRRPVVLLQRLGPGLGLERLPAPCRSAPCAASAVMPGAP